MKTKWRNKPPSNAIYGCTWPFLFVTYSELAFCTHLILCVLLISSPKSDSIILNFIYVPCLVWDEWMLQIIYSDCRVYIPGCYCIEDQLHCVPSDLKKKDVVIQCKDMILCWCTNFQSLFQYGNNLITELSSKLSVFFLDTGYRKTLLCYHEFNFVAFSLL